MKKIFLFLLAFFTSLGISEASAGYVNISTLPGYSVYTDGATEISFIINGNYVSNTFYFDDDGIFLDLNENNVDGMFGGISTIFKNYIGSQTQIHITDDNMSGGFPLSLYIYVDTINGSCGTNSTSYASGSGSYSGTFCSAGTSSPTTPSFPGQGETINWSCVGSGGGSTASCSASRDIEQSQSEYVTGSLASSIGAIASSTSTDSMGILSGSTGVLIGSILALIVVSIVIGYYFLIFRK